MTSNSPAASATDVWKVYGSGETQVNALQEINVEFQTGAFTAIMGPSGSGKSTLMHCLAGLDSTNRGTISIGETVITGMKDKELTKLRREKIGFIFQQFNLLPTLTAYENITLPAAIAGHPNDNDWVNQITKTLDLDSRLEHKPTELSGGQQQRVACARALATRPEVIFADEPTGNLDTHSGTEVLNFLRESVDTFGQTIVMVTHDPAAASYADRVVFLADGHIVDDMADPTADSVIDKMRHFEQLVAQDASAATGHESEAN
ncbi:ABC transporter ATP-binding protein [Haloglycomyces albus]|uniref:ABC transporter ATP-binding protein n=1 Tax=Haloglycomyces albus TaxID=526067 RepID=UPI00046C983C|nr:ABC transporter ATP-binding protein [Haloglycomyces albus]